MLTSPAATACAAASASFYALSASRLAISAFLRATSAYFCLSTSAALNRDYLSISAIRF